MTAQDLIDQLTTAITDDQTEIAGTAAHVAELNTEITHDQYLLNNMNTIVFLAQNNGVELDNSRLFDCFDVATKLANMYPDPGLNFNEIVTKFFNEIAKLIV